MNIYKLEFADGSLYVGMTINPIKIRLNKHNTELRRNVHHSHKMQRKYNDLGKLPKIFLLEIVPNNLGSTSEKLWIKKLDTYNNGLNCSEGGEGEYGEDHPSAKYTLDDYIAVMTLLAETDWTLIEISSELDISYNVVCSISAGHSHLYLEEIDPDTYMVMRNKAGSRLSSSQRVLKEYPPLESPNGDIISIDNIMHFCAQYNLMDGEISRLLRGKCEIHRGWKLASTVFPKVKDTNGNLFTIIPKQAKAFAESNGLDPSNFTKLLRGTALSCKGWTLA